MRKYNQFISQIFNAMNIFDKIKFSAKTFKTK